MRSDPVEQRVVDALERTGTAYEIIECDPEFADTAAFCERYGVDPAVSANTIVVGSKREPRRFVACVVLATTRLDVNGTVKRGMDAGKVSFASAEDTIGLTGQLIGGVTALDLPESLALWVDSAVMACPGVVLGGGSRSMKVRCAPRVLLDLGGKVVDGLAK